MLKIFRFLNSTFNLKRDNVAGTIKKISFESMDDIINIYEKYRDKSVREGIYYLKGSDYMKDTMERYPNPDVFNGFFFQLFDRIDEKKPDIPLEIGQLLESFMRNPSIRLGMHRSGEITNPNLYEDNTLNHIMREGLINNGAAMQGLVTSRVHPSQTVSNASDPIMAISTLKSSYRGSTGAILVGLPKDLVDVNMDFIDNTGDSILYNIDEQGMRYIKPEYILGYLSCRDENFHFYSREDILNHQKEKEH